MTPTSLFNIVLKILGVFFIKDFLATIPHLLSSILFLTSSEFRTEGIWTLLSTLVILLVYWFVCYYLIFKTELIIDQLQLDKGFDQSTFPLNIHRSTILGISVIVVGGLLVADEVPTLCGQLFSYFQEKRLTYGQTNPSLTSSIVSGVKILIGLLLMLGQRQIVNLIEVQRKK